MKKIIAIVTVVLMLMAMTVTAFAFPDPTGDSTPWKTANAFSPATYKAAKASGTINVDATKDGAYANAEKITIGAHSDQNGMDESKGAEGEAYVLYDATNLYIYVEVNDKTPHPEMGGFNADSLEIYLDFDQKSDGKKVKWNKLNSTETYAGQFRIQRDHLNMESFISICGNTTLEYAASKATAKVKDNGKSGYVVELKFPMVDKNNKLIPVSNTIGISLQINDDTDGTGRSAATYIQDGIQYWSYEYTHLFNNIKLDGGESMSWSTRSVKKDINETLKDFDPNSKVVISTKPVSSATSSKASSTASTASTASTSSIAASTASTVTSVNDASEPDAPTGDAGEIKGEDDADDGQAGDTIGAITDDENDGGLPMGALIGIIAGGVVLLAVAAVAVIVIMKKKKA